LHYRSNRITPSYFEQAFIFDMSSLLLLELEKEKLAAFFLRRMMTPFLKIYGYFPFLCTLKVYRRALGAGFRTPV
jgi:hypothetical protein